MQKNHIIHIPAIVPDFERVFYEMIKLMEVEISEELTDEVSKWKTAISVRRQETFVLWEVWVDFTWKMFSRVVKENDFEKVRKYSLSLFLVSVKVACHSRARHENLGNCKSIK